MKTAQQMRAEADAIEESVRYYADQSRFGPLPIEVRIGILERYVGNLLRDRVDELREQAEKLEKGE